MDVDAAPTVAAAGVKRKLGDGAASTNEFPLAKANAGAATQEAFNEQYLRFYYKHLFPYNLMFRWFAYGNDPDSTNPAVKRDYFLRREFTFTMADDVYIRYLCFRDQLAFEKAVNSKQPHKIDIGPVYTAPPNKHDQLKKEVFKPEERELIFDIDLTDYDDVRTCCTGANICKKCWSYMNVAVRVLDSALREDFGFNNILFVYSGRRGVHCWVCDENARALTDAARTAIVDYLTAIGHDASDGGGGGAGGGTGVSIGKVSAALTVPLHPHFFRSKAMLEDMFLKWVIAEEGQKLLTAPEYWNKVLAMIPDLPEASDGNPIPNLRATIEREWVKAGQTPLGRWDALKRWVDHVIAEAGGPTSVIRAGGRVGVRIKLDGALRSQLDKLQAAIVFTFTYPRLDVNVSKQRNHLLKAPFCVHPKTGRICVPIDPARVDLFDPTAVPTVAQLTEQGHAYQRALKAAAGPDAGAGAAAASAVDASADGSGGSDPQTAAIAAMRLGQRIPDLWTHTAMKPYIGMLDRFVSGCEAEARKAMRSQNESAAAYTGQW